jgi:hypothetical protein
MHSFSSIPALISPLHILPAPHSQLCLNRARLEYPLISTLPFLQTGRIQTHASARPARLVIPLDSRAALGAAAVCVDKDGCVLHFRFRRVLERTFWLFYGVVWWFGDCQMEGVCWRGKVGLIWELGSFSASETVRLDLLTRGRCEVSGVCCDWTRWPCGGCQIGELRAWVRCSKAVAQRAHCCRRSSSSVCST